MRIPLSLEKDSLVSKLDAYANRVDKLEASAKFQQCVINDLAKKNTAILSRR